MYHPKVVEASLERFLAAGGARIPLTREERDKGEDPRSAKFQFHPEPHTVAAVESAKEHFADLADPETETGYLTRALNLDERRWVANEKLWARIDFLYFCTRYAMIKNVLTGQLSRFALNVAQRILLDVMAEHELRGAAIEMLSLKARQLGNSTYDEICIGHRVTFYPGTNAVIASSDPDKSDKMSEMMERMWNGLPGWMVPARGAWTAARHGTGIFEFPGQNCGVSIQHGSQFTGISRGDTPDAYHLSEVSEYEDAEELIDAALMKAVHPSPRTLGFMESTAKGKNNWFHDQWLISRDGWPKGRSRLRPIFLPWFVGVDVWPTPTWVQDHPVPAGWEVPEYVSRHAERARSFVQANDLLRKHLGEGWRMPIEQLWFYDVEYQEARRKKSLNKFLEEMPADDQEAFQSTNISTFELEVIQGYRDNRRDPVGVYGLVGRTEEWPLRFQPARREIDTTLAPVQVPCRWGTGGTQFTLVPLRFQGMSEEPRDGLNRIYVWEKPVPGETYGFGLDTGDGLGQDRTVLEGMRKAAPLQGVGDRQVVEFASEYLNAFDFWPLALTLGNWYAVTSGEHRRQPRMAIECKGNGETVQLELKKRGWSNFHPWVRYDNRKIEPGKAHKLGIYTNAWFRPLMMDMLVKWLRDGWIDIPSPWFIEEMESLERDWDRQDSRACYGAHDDRIMAIGFVLISLYGLEIRKAVQTGGDGAMARVYAERGAPRGLESAGAPRWRPPQMPGLPVPRFRGSPYASRVPGGGRVY